MKAARRLQAKECWVRLRWVLVTGTWYKPPHDPAEVGRSSRGSPFLVFAVPISIDPQPFIGTLAPASASAGHRLAAEPAPRHEGAALGPAQALPLRGAKANSIDR